MAYPELDAADFLQQLARRKEFKSLISPPVDQKELIRDLRAHFVQIGGPGCEKGGRAFFPCDPYASPFPSIKGLQLHNAQLFVQNFQNPNTPYSRLLLNWQTGTGKSIAAIAIARQFMNHYMNFIENAPWIFVVGFTRAIIQTEMLRRPELGFVSYKEVAELHRLLHIAKQSGSTTSVESRHLNGFVSTLKRRLTDRNRGGFFQFYGYKEFASKLFNITSKGEEKNFDVLSLFHRSDEAEDTLNENDISQFVQKISEAETNGLIRVNQKIMEQLRGGLLIADEIHNVYNIQERNNYGIALQYVLDAFPPHQAPRAVFMSATPVTGSVMEYVDLLNLLVPRHELPNGQPLQRQQLFDSSGHSVKWKKDALALVERLSTGRVSFLLDTNTNFYPERIFAGKMLSYKDEKLPYLHFIECPMSEYQLETLKQLGPDPKISSNAYSIYDMVFPNPKFSKQTEPKAYGLFNSTETPTALSMASTDWLLENGVQIIEPSRRAPFNVSGSFLSLQPPTHISGLAFYSGKYTQMMKDILSIIRQGRGKILIYHNRVRMSGVLILQEILQSNGILNEVSSPVGTTRCSICAAIRDDHTHSDHQFIPVRFTILHSEIEPAVRERSLALFNASSNLEGHQLRILIGSKVIVEGLNFQAVRYEMIMSLPLDIPRLIQVFGRVVRKNSHMELPPSERNVTIYLYVSTTPDGGPELAKYAQKLKEYILIQEGDKALRKHAIDGFTNQIKIDKPMLESLPLSPSITPANVGATVLNTFEAYGYGEQEVKTISNIIISLFMARPVWTYSELWKAVSTPKLIQGITIDNKLFSEDNFALALISLCYSKNQCKELWIQNRLCTIMHVPAKPEHLYVAAVLNHKKEPVLDIETYIRDFQPPTMHSIRITKYLEHSQTKEPFQVLYEKFQKDFQDEPMEQVLIHYPASFHYTMLEALIIDNLAGMGALVEVYKKFFIAFSKKDIQPFPDIFKIISHVPGDDNTLVGYATEDSVRLITSHEDKTWHEIPLYMLNINVKRKENDIVIGYMESKGKALKFKIRPPIQVLKKNEITDIRMLNRGAVCETRGREEQQKIANQLGISLNLTKISAIKLCLLIRNNLLQKEMEARNQPNGMQDGIRWFYLFNDKMPSLVHTS